MRFRTFSARYRLLVPGARGRGLFRTDEKAVDDCETILDCYSRQMKVRKIEIWLLYAVFLSNIRNGKNMILNFCNNRLKDI